MHIAAFGVVRSRIRGHQASSEVLPFKGLQVPKLIAPPHPGGTIREDEASWYEREPDRQSSGDYSSTANAIVRGAAA